MLKEGAYFNHCISERGQVKEWLEGLCNFFQRSRSMAMQIATNIRPWNFLANILTIWGYSSRVIGLLYHVLDNTHSMAHNRYVQIKKHKLGTAGYLFWLWWQVWLIKAKFVFLLCSSLNMATCLHGHPQTENDILHILEVAKDWALANGKISCFFSIYILFYIHYLGLQEFLFCIVAWCASCLLSYSFL